MDAAVHRPVRVVASRSHGAFIVTVMALAFGLRAAGLSTDDFNEDEIGVNVLTSASLIANHSRRRQCDPASAVSTHSRHRRRSDVRRRYTDALARSRSHPRARRWTVRLFVEAVHRRLSHGTHRYGGSRAGAIAVLRDRPTDPGAIVAVDLSADSGYPIWKRPIRTYFRRVAGGGTLVGLERLPAYAAPRRRQRPSQ